MFRQIAYTCTALSLAAIGTGLATPCDAQTDMNPRLTVDYSDLDLSRPAGAKVLLERMSSAAQTVCGSEPDIGHMGDVARHDDCVSHAMDGAVRSIHRALVADLYGKPQLVAEDGPMDVAQITSEMSKPAAQADQQNRGLGERIGAFFAELFQ